MERVIILEIDTNFIFFLGRAMEQRTMTATFPLHWTTTFILFLDLWERRTSDYPQQILSVECIFTKKMDKLEDIFYFLTILLLLIVAMTNH